MYLQFFQQIQKNNGDISPTSDNRRLFTCATPFLPPHPMLQEGYMELNILKFKLFYMWLRRYLRSNPRRLSK